MISATFGWDVKEGAGPTAGLGVVEGEVGKGVGEGFGVLVVELFVAVLHEHLLFITSLECAGKGLVGKVVEAGGTGEGVLGGVEAGGSVGAAVEEGGGGGHGGHNLGDVFHSLGPCTPDGGVVPAEHVREVEAAELAGEGKEGVVAAEGLTEDLPPGCDV